MIQIRTLGGFSVTPDERGPVDLTRRRSVALLAVLAVTAPHPVARDKLMALIWPELDEERARNALNQTLFAIRRELGHDVILGRADLRLNTDVVASDVTGFVAAATQGRPEEAVALYGGPFLDGFFLSETPDFERWVDETRGRLKRRMAASLRELAIAADRTGDLKSAAELRWRITEIDPLDSSAAFDLIRALADAGDRSRALQFARHHESLLRQEIGTGVDPAMSQFVRRLLAEGDSLPPAAIPLVAGVGPASVVPAATAGAPPLGSPRGGRRPMIAAAAVLVIGVASAWYVARGSPGSDPSHRPSAVAIAVLPFKVQGNPDAQFLRDGLVELVGRAIDGAGNVRSVDPGVVRRVIGADAGVPDDVGRSAQAARDMGAPQFVLGNVVATATSLRVSATLHEGTGGVVASATEDGSPDELPAIVDRLASRLLAARRGPGRRAASDVSSLSRRSLPALKAYLTGQSLRHDGRYPEAVEAFQAAVREDSTFALAWYALSNAADWASRQDISIPAARQAARFSEGLTERDRLLVQAHLAWRETRIEAAERLYRVLLHAYPDDAEAWYQFGELLFHLNPLRGRTFTEARSAFERVRQLSPSDWESLSHLVRITLRDGQDGAIDSIITVALREAPPRDHSELRALRAFALHDRAAQHASLAELRTVDGVVLSVISWRLSVYAVDLDGAEQVLRLGAAAPNNGLAARSALAWVLLGLGRWREAEAEMDSANRVLKSEATINTALFRLRALQTDSAVFDGIGIELDGDAAAALARGTAADSAAGLTALCLSGIVAAQGGRAQRATQVAAVLEMVRGPEERRHQAQSCAASVRARLDVHGGRHRMALNRLLAARRDRVSLADHEALDRFLIAEMAFTLGERDEARRWFRSTMERGLEEVPLLAAAERRLGQLAELQGDAASAAKHYSLVASLWANADPEHRSAVDDVRERLEAVRKTAGASATGARGLASRRR